MNPVPISYPIAPTVRLNLFFRVLRIRMVEEAIAASYGDQEMRCPVHLSIGQEAAAVGACAPLLAEDVIFSTHRCHGHYLAKGGSLVAMIAELHGRATGCCGGRGGSMHLFDDDAGVMASVPIVGSNIPLAVGAALAFSQRGQDNVAVAFVGDAAMEEGVFHESLNFAATNCLPVVFFVENNQYSVYTRLDERQPGSVPGRFAHAHEIPCAQADGNDTMAVYGAMRAAVARARNGGGPSLVAVETYRFVEHCGPSDDDHLGYRPKEEVSAWKAKCPVVQFERALRAEGVLSNETLALARRQITAEIDAAFAAAKQAPYPAAETLGMHVLDDGPSSPPMLEVL